MRRTLIHGLVLALGAGMAGCTDEIPTAVGGELIGVGYRTYEVVLDAPSFLEADTTYTGLGSLNFAPFGLAANAFGGELFANTLIRIRRPTQVTYQKDGASVTDSAFTVVGGTLTLIVDSLSESSGAVDLELLEVTESWDAGTVTWEERFDTAGVSEPWQEPGGTTGELLGRSLGRNGDTLRIVLDSAATAVWVDSAGASNGGLIRMATMGARLRMESVQFAFDLRPEGADTVVTGGSIISRAIVATPEPSSPPQSELRVGGVPVWRTALHFRPLEEIMIPCAPGSGTCEPVALSKVGVDLAALLLQPVQVLDRRIEKPLRIEGRAVLRAPGVPITRSALSPVIGGTPTGIEPDVFTADPAEPGRVAIPVTAYVRQTLAPPGDSDPVLWLALLAQLEQALPLFGYAAFASIESDNPPQLRLVVTVPTQE